MQGRWEQASSHLLAMRMGRTSIKGGNNEGRGGKCYQTYSREAAWQIDELYSHQYSPWWLHITGGQ